MPDSFSPRPAARDDLPRARLFPLRFDSRKRRCGADDIVPTACPAANIAGSASAPLVSLCVSAHHYGRFLAVCIDSILGQSYPDIECIVVDDGSTDETDDVLARYADRIRVVRHAVVRGQLAAMVTGFRLAQGQFVSFVDAHDYLYRTSYWPT